MYHVCQWLEYVEVLSHIVVQCNLSQTLQKKTNNLTTIKCLADHRPLAHNEASQELAQHHNRCDWPQIMI